MSGWIKVERSLKTDLRFGKAAKKLDLEKIFQAVVTSPERYMALRNTLLLGALTQLWLHADEHVREDDILRCSVDDMNEFIGVENLCQALPTDWLMVIDPDHVKVTDFVAHNGSSARTRKLNAARVARYRERHGVTSSHNRDVTPSNAGNALRQTRQNKKEEGMQGEKSPRGGRPRSGRPRDDAAWAEAGAHAAAVGFRAPLKDESATDYARAIKASQDDGRTPAAAAMPRIAALRAKLQSTS